MNWHIINNILSNTYLNNKKKNDKFRNRRVLYKLFIKVHVYLILKYLLNLLNFKYIYNFNTNKCLNTKT